ncbi:transcriptional regulator GfcR [Halapricum desulfuricans]|uniref:Transcriptional regulator GfcR n=1 Tax=Halapricum desulfuricans TaxID=2841257 RepID=A0A897NJN5_9EURY|nr:transcriptional regulator GfcR [Halapricum desulfuricans]QSG07470.1 Orotate phosphoribosyltransferase-like protein [Halapricum desulfuricans]QSG10486.1 Orotate phosphoribosyltransferase-like protein [Halapricum desulfuricans]
MKSIDTLVESAAELTDNGLSKGEIADELNVSRETASWLVAQTGRESIEEEIGASPVDVHVDWSAIGRDSHRLGHLGAIMADLLAHEGEDVDLTIGIGKSGAPLATVIGRELDTDLSVYMPSKYQWDDDQTETSGSFSRNFSGINDKDCYIVDDNIDTGQTMTETIKQVRDNGGSPQAGVVLTDKLGQDEINGVPIYSLIEIVQMSDG